METIFELLITSGFFSIEELTNFLVTISVELAGKP
jgi:hypothetical protein